MAHWQPRLAEIDYPLSDARPYDTKLIPTINVSSWTALETLLCDHVRLIVTDVTSKCDLGHIPSVRNTV